MAKVLKNLENLPKTTWSQNQQSATRSSLLRCEMCLENYNDHEWVVPLSCSPEHTFHLECATQYFEKGVKSELTFYHRCPLCYKEVEVGAV